MIIVLITAVIQPFGREPGQPQRECCYYPVIFQLPSSTGVVILRSLCARDYLKMLACMFHAEHDLRCVSNPSISSEAKVTMTGASGHLPAAVFLAEGLLCHGVWGSFVSPNKAKVPVPNSNWRCYVRLIPHL